VVAQARAETPRERGTPAEPTEAQRRARIRLDLATAYYSDNRFDDALAEVRLALDAAPDNPQALNLRALIASALGDDVQAIDNFKRALSLAPNDTDVLHNYGWYLCQRGNYVEADAQFQRVLGNPQYRTPSRTMLVQGICEARAGRLDKAEQVLRRSYEIDAGNPATAMNLADVLYRRGEFDKARFYVRRVNDNPELRNAESLWLAARVENRMGNPQGVRDLGNQLRSSYPASREAAALERGAFDE
jgi:type IV pilus assembly protein PilF